MRDPDDDDLIRKGKSAEREDSLRLVCLTRLTPTSAFSISASLSDASMRAAQSLSLNLIGVEVALSRGGSERKEGGGAAAGGTSDEDEADEKAGGDSVAATVIADWRLKEELILIPTSKSTSNFTTLESGETSQRS